MRKPALTEKVMRGLLILDNGMIQGAWHGGEDVRNHGFSREDERDAMAASAWINRMKKWRDRRSGEIRVKDGFDVPFTNPEGGSREQEG